MRLAQRNQFIEPFYVMDVVRAAAEQQTAWEAQGRRMIHLSVGEPDFTAPEPVVEAATCALRDGRTGYTLAPGLPALRERIAQHYAQVHGVTLDPARVFITAGASGALTLASLLLFNPGDEVLMPDPSYPCNKNFVAAAGARARMLPAPAAQRFQLSASEVEAAWTPQTAGVLLASPSNPTGTSIAPDELRRIADVVRARGGVSIVDEIYLGLSYEVGYGHTALAAGDDIITVNSFSKYFQMTGWRLGWLVVPPSLVAPLERMAGNLFICASSVAQQAALACFEPDTLTEYERRRAEFQRRRDLIVPGLEALGLRVPVRPDGAFYVYADCSAYSADSWDFCFEVMRDTGVVLVPGKDFGTAEPQRYFRLSYANSIANLQEALARLCGYLERKAA
ncbi:MULTISPECIES: pyridoxal phosphate-dependent aminotransferase [unclassified Thiomonas]|jgi:aspartate/methionine/tyrosine aminotransferase|uniref:pyridoxal phosphate-dependent aminotransferase n=1 Tax=unclassified Thiomonas TaxID=2625466 RepID=UPI0004DB9842|nr:MULTISPECIES: pyridoxal phosphate-dependent aminotransferase [unclassified Thiomonas]MDD5001548.1 pyridoxal phosphate-dependent aminotransferase [Thiomonas arsenitoxydans]CDW93247.1 putative aspartate aminotransferase [Thiomonas sp. CB2]VDY06232.1 putative aspartate aminotransferase [Thiomonas sp. Bio17B3]VDY10472.1 putative aspartate aminotransferase [Thiomonas sp. Sup16B3]VDY14503.1 putative aspartate aminotransferase [Thiomonas sp. OC7]